MADERNLQYEINIETRNSEDNLNRLEREYRRTTTTMRQAEVKQRGFNRTLQGASGGMSKIGKTLGSVSSKLGAFARAGTLAFGKIGLAVGAVVASIGAVGVAFDKAMKMMSSLNMNTEALGRQYQNTQSAFFGAFSKQFNKIAEGFMSIGNTIIDSIYAATIAMLQGIEVLIIKVNRSFNFFMSSSGAAKQTIEQLKADKQALEKGAIDNIVTLFKSFERDNSTLRKIAKDISDGDVEQIKLTQEMLERRVVAQEKAIASYENLLEKEKDVTAIADINNWIAQDHSRKAATESAIRMLDDLLSVNKKLVDVQETAIEESTVITSIREWIQDLRDNLKTADELTKLENERIPLLLENVTRLANAEAELKEAITDSADTAKSEELRIQKVTNALREYTEAKVEHIEISKQNLRIAQLNASFGDNNFEDEMNLRRLQAEISQREGELSERRREAQGVLSKLRTEQVSFAIELDTGAESTQILTDKTSEYLAVIALSLPLLKEYNGLTRYHTLLQQEMLNKSAGRFKEQERLLKRDLELQKHKLQEEAELSYQSAKTTEEEFDISFRLKERQAKLDEDFAIQKANIDIESMVAVLDAEVSINQARMASQLEVYNYGIDLAEDFMATIGNLTGQAVEFQILGGLARIGANLAQGLSEAVNIGLLTQRNLLMLGTPPPAAIAAGTIAAGRAKTMSIVGAGVATARLLSELASARGQLGNAGGNTGGGNAATSRAGGGGTFITNGRTQLEVGDNPGGREIVSVTPIGGRGTTFINPNDNISRLSGGIMNTGLSGLRSSTSSYEMMTQLSSIISNMPAPVVEVKEIVDKSNRLIRKGLVKAI